jgi:hypothetical protein
VNLDIVAEVVYVPNTRCPDDILVGFSSRSLGKGVDIMSTMASHIIV